MCLPSGWISSCHLGESRPGHAQGVTDGGKLLPVPCHSKVLMTQETCKLPSLMWLTKRHNSLQMITVHFLEVLMMVKFSVFLCTPLFFSSYQVSEMDIMDIIMDIICKWWNHHLLKCSKEHIDVALGDIIGYWWVWHCQGMTAHCQRAFLTSRVLWFSATLLLCPSCTTGQAGLQCS